MLTGKIPLAAEPQTTRKREENAGSKSESGFRETGIMLKRLFGETHIRAVQIRPDVEQQKERD
jgi:hypothetical protein